MSTLAEIETAVPDLTAEELLELEQFVRRTRQQKAGAVRPSLRDLEPVSAGGMLRPLGTRDEWYDEMLEGRI